MTRSLLHQIHRWFAVGIFLAEALSCPAQTWIQWKTEAGGNNHYYALTPIATNWTAAQALAVSWGGTLATITSSNEQAFINNTFLTGKFEHLPLWIGLTSPLQKGLFSGKLGPIDLQIGIHSQANFRWVTGEPFSFSNWKPGEPSNTPPGENYVVINWENSDTPPRGVKGDWNDTPVNGTSGYGGKTDGPYFGLVERETDPSQPPPWVGKKAAFYLAAILALIIAILIYFSRPKRRASSSP